MVLPPETYMKIKEGIIKNARKHSVARQIIGVRPLNAGVGLQQWAYDSLEEVSDAQITYAFTETGEDVADFTRNHIPIPVLHKEFRIPYRDIITAQKGGFPLQAATADSASYKIMLLENSMLMNGYAADGTNYDILGLYQGAGNSESTSKDFGTAGNALDKVQLAITEMLADDIYGPYNLVLNHVQFMELAVSVLGSGAGEREMPMVKELLGGGQIISTPFQAVDTGMLLAQPGSGFFEAVMPVDITVRTETLQKSRDEWGQIYECIVPVIYNSDGICKLTAI
jgi:uncharacterized linocin/CFP29 family protein